MRRSLTDPDWAEEVARRWTRRRYRVQQRDKAMADLAAAFDPLMMWIDRQLRRSPRLYRWLSR